MVEVIPTLINVISMIHNISRYYNTSQRMTSLFIKVTNQMVTACRKYITDNGSRRIWDQESAAVNEKIGVRTNNHCFYRSFVNVVGVSREVQPKPLFSGPQSFLLFSHTNTVAYTLLQSCKNIYRFYDFFCCIFGYVTTPTFGKGTALPPLGGGTLLLLITEVMTVSCRRKIWP